jgi:hypothetical protein
MSDLATAKTWTASKWLSLAQPAGVLSDQLGQAKNDQARAIALGKFLGGKVGREIPLAVGKKTGKAVLRATPGRSRQTGYYFEITWDTPMTDDPKPDGKKKKKKDEAVVKGQKTKPKPKLAGPTGGGNDEGW